MEFLAKKYNLGRQEERQFGIPVTQQASHLGFLQTGRKTILDSCNLVGISCLIWNSYRLEGTNLDSCKLVGIPYGRSMGVGVNRGPEKVQGEGCLSSEGIQVQIGSAGWVDGLVGGWRWIVQQDNNTTLWSSQLKVNSFSAGPSLVIC